MNKVETLTVREIGIAERAAGNVSIEVLETAMAPGKLTMLAAVAWVIDKRDNHKSSYDDWQDKPVTEIMSFLGLNEDEDPKAS